jgi:hypothetical protein
MITSGMLALAGCAKHTVDVQPIRVEPIHVTLDVNIRVDRELEEFFDFEQEINVHPATQPTDEMEVEVSPPAATRPAAIPDAGGGGTS